MDKENDPLIVLTPSEIRVFKDMMATITVDDLKCIKEYADDRRAITRVVAKIKNFTLVTSAIVLAYFAIIRNVLPPIRELLLKFLQGGN
jgi:hypothetical protein